MFLHVCYVHVKSAFFSTVLPTQTKIHPPMLPVIWGTLVRAASGQVQRSQILLYSILYASM